MTIPWISVSVDMDDIFLTLMDLMDLTNNLTLYLLLKLKF